MELLTEFPGSDGLHRFKEWWRKVQSGTDRAEDTKSKFRKRFKKKFKELFLPEDWPNPAVRDSYYHPTVDHSEEPFKWGIPDLDALRSYFQSELGWGQDKVDDLLLPIIQKMNRRSQQDAMAKQGNLTAFFDAPVGGVAPRKRQAYASKRLQQVVADFRKKQSSRSGSSTPSAPGEDRPEDEEEEDTSEAPPTKRRKSSTTASSRGTGTAKRGRGGRGRGRGGRGGRSGRQSATGQDRGKKQELTADIGSGSDSDEYVPVNRPAEEDGPAPSSTRPRPRPRPLKKPNVSTVNPESASTPE